MSRPESIFGKIKILTAGIHRVFRGLKFLVDVDIGKKGHFRSGTKVREVTINNIPILLVFLSVFCVAIIDEYFNILLLSRLEYEQKSCVI